MKKAILLLAVMCTVLFAQGKPRVVIFASGTTPSPEVLTYLYSQMEAHIQNSGKYEVLAQSQAITARIEKEIGRQQMTRAINDAQLVKLGNELGVGYVINIECNTGPVGGTYTLGLKRVSMETRGLVGTVALVEDIKFSSNTEIRRNAIQLADHFLKGATDYGAGIVLSSGIKDDPLTKRVVSAVRTMATFRQTACGKGGIEVMIEVELDECDDGACRADITVTATDCEKGDEIQAVAGKVEGRTRRDVENKLRDMDITLVSPKGGASFDSVLRQRLTAWSRGQR